MKTLLIMRHAKSSWKTAGQADRDRPLNKRGKNDAPRMGKLLAEQSIAPDVILCSTANRASQTCEGVLQGADWKCQPTPLDQLYLASPETICSCLSELDQGVDCALVIAHNPGLTELVQELTGEVDHMPTGAIAQIELDIADWAKLSGPLDGELVNFWIPKEL